MGQRLWHNSTSAVWPLYCIIELPDNKADLLVHPTSGLKSTRQELDVDIRLHTLSLCCFSVKWDSRHTSSVQLSRKVLLYMPGKQIC